jgi:hypothetical protein
VVVALFLVGLRNNRCGGYLAVGQVLVVVASWGTLPTAARLEGSDAIVGRLACDRSA